MSIKHTDIVPCPKCNGPRTIVIGETKVLTPVEIKDAYRYVGESNMERLSPDLYRKLKPDIDKIKGPLPKFNPNKK